MTFLETSIWGMTILSWLKLIGITFLISGILVAIKRLLFSRFSELAKKTDNNIDDVLAELLFGLRTFFLVVLSFYIAVEHVAVEAPDLPWLYRVVFFGILVQFGLSCNDLVKQMVGFYVIKKDGEPSQVTAARALGLVGKIVIWIVVLLVAIDNLGVDITALVAGLGIGGIAIALAVKDILSDLLAYVSIIVDQPFSIGEFLVVGEFSGTVEHIGIKTTRIRSLSGEQIIFSNTDLLSSRLRNYKRMNERRALFSLGVTYDTSYENLKAIPEIVQKAIEGQENTRFDRAHMKNYGDFSINYEIVYFMLVPEYLAKMDTQQRINLEIHQAFKERGISFAFPTQTIHLEKAE